MRKNRSQKARGDYNDATTVPGILGVTRSKKKEEDISPRAFIRIMHKP